LGVEYETNGLAIYLVSSIYPTLILTEFLKTVILMCFTEIRIKTDTSIMTRTELLLRGHIATPELVLTLILGIHFTETPVVGSLDRFVDVMFVTNSDFELALLLSLGSLLFDLETHGAALFEISEATEPNGT